MSGGFKRYADLGQWFEEPVREDFETLDRLSREFAVENLKRSLADIDTAFGRRWYAEENPVLLAAVMRARTEHFRTMVLAKTLQEGLASIAETLDAIFGEIVKITDR